MHYYNESDDFMKDMVATRTNRQLRRKSTRHLHIDQGASRTWGYTPDPG